MTNLSVQPSKRVAIAKVIFHIFLGIVEVIVGIFLIGFVIYTYLDGKYKGPDTLVIAIMGVIAVALGIGHFYMAKTGREI